jgi:cytochrome c-type biogenesis protein CcmE
MTKKRRRLWLLLACALGLGSAVGLSLVALSQDVTFFVTPSDLFSQQQQPDRLLRLGGLVSAGSIHRKGQETPEVSFQVTDNKHSITVQYNGILPDLFREGQGVVVLGEMQLDGSFLASEVLAKHDETYMPKDVADALIRQGTWHPETGRPPS